MGQPGRAEPRPPRSALLLQLSPEPRLSDQGGPVATGTEGAQPTARGWGRRGIRRGSGTLAFGAHTHPLPSLERGTRPRTHPRLRSRRRWSRGWHCKGAGRGWPESQEAGSRPGCYPDKRGLICCRLQPEAPFLPGLCAFLPRLCACSPAVALLPGAARRGPDPASGGFCVCPLRMAQSDHSQAMGTALVYHEAMTEARLLWEE